MHIGLAANVVQFLGLLGTCQNLAVCNYVLRIAKTKTLQHLRLAQAEQGIRICLGAKWQ
jgi:hypothetical protein